MIKNELEGCRILLVQSDPIIALKLAEAFAAEGAEVVTTFGLSETFHEIGKSRLDGAIVHLDLEHDSALPAAVLLQELGIPQLVVARNHLSAFLARFLPGAVALEPGFPTQVAVDAMARAICRRVVPGPPIWGVAQAPQRQN